jgi:hypothetical protein
MQLVVVIQACRTTSISQWKKSARYEHRAVDASSDCPDDLLFFMAEKSRHAEERQRGMKRISEATHEIAHEMA